MLRLRGGMEGLVADRGRQGERILDAVPHLAEHHILVSFRRLPLADVARDLRGADDPSASARDRGHRQRHVEEAAILSLPDRLVVVDAFAAPDAGEDLRLFALSVGGQQDRDRLSQDLLPAVSVQPLGASIEWMAAWMPPSDTLLAGVRGRGSVRRGVASTGGNPPR